MRIHTKHLIATALEVEVSEMVNELKRAGRGGVRKVYMPERSVTTVVGDVEVEMPRIRARNGSRSSSPPNSSGVRPEARTYFAANKEVR